MADFDLAIIGGGINGTGIARDAAGRGLRVLLVEHERSRLRHLVGLQQADPWRPALSRTRRLPAGARGAERARGAAAHGAARDPADALHAAAAAGPAHAAASCGSGCSFTTCWARASCCPAPRTVDLTHHPVGQPLKRSFRYGFEYSDCWVDDSRLVVLNALDAAEHGAVIRTRTRCMRVERRDEWELVLNSRGRRDVATARVLVNAAGPWIGEVAETVIRKPLKAPVRLIKGSHIVVRRRFEHDSGYILQTADGRVVFALPFAEDFTLIGTTDENFVGDLNSPAPDRGGDHLSLRRR